MVKPWKIRPITPPRHSFPAYPTNDNPYLRGWTFWLCKCNRKFSFFSSSYSYFLLGQTFFLLLWCTAKRIVRSERKADIHFWRVRYHSIQLLKSARFYLKRKSVVEMNSLCEWTTSTLRPWNIGYQVVQNHWNEDYVASHRLTDQNSTLWLNRKAIRIIPIDGNRNNTNKWTWK